MKENEDDYDYTLDYQDEPQPPDSAFTHVERASDNGVRENMIVEFKYRDDKFWLAKIDKVFGPLLKLIYVGPETEDDAASKVTDSHVLWHDLTKSKLYPLGFCQMNKQRLEPPDDIRESLSNWQTIALKYLEDVRYETIPMHLMDKDAGTTPAERIRPGMVMEIRDESDFRRYWTTEVVRNRGGILTLRYDSPKKENISLNEIRLCYLSNRLRRNRSVSDIYYEPPKELKDKYIDDDDDVDWTQFRDELSRLHRPLPPEDFIFYKNLDVPESSFEIHTALEIIHPRHHRTLELGVIQSIFHNQLIVRLRDNDDNDIDVVVDAESLSLFPLGWSKKSELEDVRSETLVRCQIEETAAPDSCFSSVRDACSFKSFKPGQIVEVQYKDEEMYIGTIRNVIGPLLRIELRLSDDSLIHVLMPQNSFRLFPLGWSFANEVPIRIDKSKQIEQQQQQQRRDKDEKQQHDQQQQPQHSSSWCKPIYFNYKCSSASFLSKKRLSSLPKSVGPGPVRLVMREVLSMIIGSSFKSGSVLKRLEFDSDEHPPRKNFYLDSFKGKSRVHILKADIEVPSLSEDVDGYCQEICKKVGACPYLVSTRLYENGCPASCHSIETTGGAGRPRKRKNMLPIKENKDVRVEKDHEESYSSTDETDDVSRNTSRSASPSNGLVEPPQGHAPPPSRKRNQKREWSDILPKSEIRTRGAKLPVDWKLHLKIRPTKKEQRVIENNEVRESIGWYESSGKRIKSDIINKTIEPAFKMTDIPPKERECVNNDDGDETKSEPSSEEQTTSLTPSPPCVPSSSLSSSSPPPSPGSPPPIRVIHLSSNPSLWTPVETARFLAQTLDCWHLAPFMYEDEIDGPAFLLLNYPTVKEYWSLKTITAIQLCQHVESVKLAYLNKSYQH